MTADELVRYPILARAIIARAVRDLAQPGEDARDAYEWIYSDADDGTGNPAWRNTVFELADVSLYKMREALTEVTEPGVLIKLSDALCSARETQTQE